jgi:sortase A
VTVTTDASADAEPTQPVPEVRLDGEPTPKPSRAKHRVRRGAIVAATAVVGVVLVAILFQGPLAHVWYQSRQQNLGGDFNAKRRKAAKGQALAVLQIPRINVNLVVVEGDGPTQLRGGPGHRIGTPLPGQVGNSLIFGHRSGWGAPFSKLAQLHAGDQIVLQPRTQQPISFKVLSVSRVGGGDVRPLAASDDHRVTLVTGTGGGFSGERLVVAAVSGDPGKLSAPKRGLRATTRHGPVILNATVGVFLLLVAASVLALRWLRPRHKTATTALVVTPLALGAVLALLLELDLLLLSPLH